MLNHSKYNKPGISFYWSSIGTDEKLFKVPGDVSSPDWLPDEELRVGHQVLSVVSRGGQSALQELEHRMLIFPISLHLVKDVSLELKSIARPDVLQSIQDLLALGILLVPEL